MNCVYIVTLRKRLNNKTPPYYYVGYKSNCSYEDGVLYDKSGKPYYGSSKSEEYHEMVKTEDPFVEILFEGKTASECIEYETWAQRENDVAANPEYFNKMINGSDNFCDPAYATYKHTETGKICRLRRDHPSVLNGDYVGVTRGCSIDEAGRKARSDALLGDKNYFYGKTHTQETKDAISRKNKGHKRWEKRSPEDREKTLAIFRQKKSAEHRKKIGRKGLVMLRNSITGETVRVSKSEASKLGKEWACPNKGKVMLKNIETMECVSVPREEKHLYDPEIWMNPKRVKKVLNESNKR